MNCSSTFRVCFFSFALLLGCKSEKENPVTPPSSSDSAPYASTWVQTAQPPGSAQVYGFASYDKELFVATYGGGAFVSTNNGDSWKGINSGLPELTVNCIAIKVDGPNNQSLLAASSMRLFRSLDSGTSWTLIRSGLGDYRSIDIIPGGSASSIIFVYEIPIASGGMHGSFIEGGGFFRSSDNGSNWDQITSGLSSSNSGLFNVTFNPVDSSIYGCNDHAVYRSTDHGMSWISTTQIPTDITSLAISTNIPNGTALYVSTYYHGIYSSTNQGLSWEDFNFGMSNRGVNNIYCVMVADSSIFAGTVFDGVFVRNTAGSGWMAVNSGLSENSIRTLAVHGSFLFAGSDSGRVWRRSLTSFSQP